MKILPSILVLVFAIIFSTGQASLGGQTADECMTRPGPAGPKGTHWYYRINRTDSRHCWYLGSQAVPTVQASWRLGLASRRAELPDSSPQPTTDVSVEQAAQMMSANATFLGPPIGVATLDFVRRWPDLPMPADLAIYAERRVDAYAEEQIPVKRLVVVDRERARLQPDSDQAGNGAVSLIGAIAMASLLVVGGILKLAGYLGDSLQRVLGRLGWRMLSDSDEKLGVNPAPRGPEDRIARQAPTPTDPAHDLKTSLRELMQDLRRAGAAADSHSSFARRRRPSAGLGLRHAELAHGR